MKIEKAEPEKDITQTKKDITKIEGVATSDLLEIRKWECSDNDDEGSLSKKTVSDVKFGSGVVQGSSNMKDGLEEEYVHGKTC